ncbi:MAG TPA: EscU/YscU/HrcU family type III secretion system export apparatus switch protein, partial [Kofleriaceae bacterium]
GSSAATAGANSADAAMGSSAAVAGANSADAAMGSSAAVAGANSADAAMGSSAAADAVAGSSGAGVADPHSISFDAVLSRVLELAAPLLVAAAVAALVAHVAQTRALWLPRRRIPRAPVVEPARVQRDAFDMIAAAAIGVVAFAWLWTTAPHLARLFVVERPLPAIASALASLLVALAIAWVVLGTVDALLRRAELTRALAMTVTEKREDDRLAAADPRWRTHRAALARGPSASTAVAQAALVLLGDDVAIAIAWDPRRHPIPLRSSVGRRARATQLVGLARRYRVPVHRDPALVAALAGAEGPVPDAYWARLAEVIAAVQTR